MVFKVSGNLAYKEMIDQKWDKTKRKERPRFWSGGNL